MKSAAHENDWVVYAALAANVGVCIAKFVAGAFSGSAALIAEGVHSLAGSYTGHLAKSCPSRFSDSNGAFARLTRKSRGSS
ncbi:MAG: cation transporter [Polyangiaceae bacterium]